MLARNCSPLGDIGPLGSNARYSAGEPIQCPKAIATVARRIETIAIAANTASKSTSAAIDRPSTPIPIRRA